MYGKLDFWNLCWIGYSRYFVYVVCISDYKVDVVVVCVGGVRDSVICLCVRSCSEMESDRQVDVWLGEIIMFYNGSDVEVIAGCFLQHYSGCGVEGAT